MNSNNREQFLLDRKTGIGGSDIAAIMGLNPWKSALDVYCDKVDEELTTTPDTPALIRGRKLEKYILEEYSDQNNVELETGLPMLRDKKYPFLIGNVDAKVKNKNVIVEAKSVGGSSSKWGGGIPDYYKTQVAHYASLGDSDSVDVAVLFDRWEFCQYLYNRDETFEEQIRQVAIDFWHNHVLKGIPPAISNLDDAKKLYSRPQNAVLQANDYLRGATKELTELEIQKKTLEMKILQVKCALMDNLGDNEVLEDNGQTLITWRNSTRRIFDVTSFKEQHEDLHNKFIKNVVSRTFRIC